MRSRNFGGDGGVKVIWRNPDLTGFSLLMASLSQVCGSCFFLGECWGVTLVSDGPVRLRRGLLLTVIVLVPSLPRWSSRGGVFDVVANQVQIKNGIEFLPALEVLYWCLLVFLNCLLASSSRSLKKVLIRKSFVNLWLLWSGPSTWLVVATCIERKNTILIKNVFFSEFKADSSSMESNCKC